jgi:membrane protein
MNDSEESFPEGLKAERQLAKVLDTLRVPPTERARRFVSWLLAEMRHLLHILFSSTDRFYNDNGFSRAASLAYTTLLSLVPLTTLIFGFLASFASLESYLPGVREFLFKQFIPNAGGVDKVLGFLEAQNRAVASVNVVVIPFLVITSLLLINSIEYALNQVWQVYESRSIPQRIAAACAMMVIAPIFAISMYYTTKFRVGPLFSNIASQVSFITSLYEFLVPFLIDFIAFSSLYYLVPKAPVFFRAALAGGFVSALLFFLAKGGFAIYIRDYSSYELMYGTLATIPIFLFWLYLAWAIVLYGAEVAYHTEYLPRTGYLFRRHLLSIGDGRFINAIQALVIIGRAFSLGERLPNEIELCERLGCSSVVLKPTLDALRRAGILARSDTRVMELTLTCAPEKIQLSQVWRCLFPQKDLPSFPTEIERSLQPFLGQGSDISLAQVIHRSV